MEIKVKDCNDCIFCILERDEWAIGDSDLYYCQLKKSKFFTSQEYIITTSHGWDEIKLETPEWCPLKKYKTVNIQYDE